MPEIELHRIERQLALVPIKGVTPLIQNKFSEKARQQMLDKQMGKTTHKKAPKSPEENYQAAMHVLADGRHGVPAPAFKAALVGAARFFEGITMVALKTAVYVRGEGPDQLVPITGEPVMREDPVRNSGGVADLRHRPMFVDWSAILPISFVPMVLSAESVVALVDAAGMGGVGEWRPTAPKSFTGTFGCWEVLSEEVEVR